MAAHSAGARKPSGSALPIYVFHSQLHEVDGFVRKRAMEGCEAKESLSTATGQFRPLAPRVWVSQVSVLRPGKQQICAVVALVSQMKTHLQSTRIGRCLASDLSKLTRGRIQVWCGPVGVVDEVVGIGGELHVGRLRNGKLLLKRKIPVLISRLIDRVPDALLKIESALRRSSEDRRAIRIGSGEVLSSLTRIARKLMDYLWLPVHVPELAFGAATETAVLADTCIVGTDSDAARRSSLELGNAA